MSPLSHRARSIPHLLLATACLLVSGLAVRAADPPVYLTYPTPPRMGEPEKDATHAAAFGLGLQRRCEELKVPCGFVYPGAPEVKHEDMYAFLKARLKPADKAEIR